MQKTDWLLKVLLALLALGVWGMVLSPFIPGFSSRAQARRQYSVWVANDKAGKLGIGGEGSLPLTATGLMQALEETPKQGWRVNSVVYSSGGGGYVVIVEK
jgi:hypothetical protein